jgi:hypothetical protein
VGAGPNAGVAITGCASLVFFLLFFYIFFQGLNAGVANARCASLVFFLLFLYFYILFFQGLMQALPTLDAQVGVVAAATASPCH